MRAFLAWAPISDLSAWFHESRARHSRYCEDILLCTASGGFLDRRKAEDRSPLFWDLPETPRGRLELYAGIDDGYVGSVPVSHSVRFFNRVVDHYGLRKERAGEAEVVKLLARGVERSGNLGTIGGRQVVFERNTAPVSLTIFEGGHEMLIDYCFDRLKQFVRRPIGTEAAAPSRIFLR